MPRLPGKCTRLMYEEVHEEVPCWIKGQRCENTSKIEEHEFARNDYYPTFTTIELKQPQHPLEHYLEMSATEQPSKSPSLASTCCDDENKYSRSPSLASTICAQEDFQGAENPTNRSRSPSLLSTQDDGWQLPLRPMRAEDLPDMQRPLLPSYTTTFGRKSSPARVERSAKITEVVRHKNARQKMPGWTCPECHNFYEALVEQGLVSRQKLPSFLQQVSRHKAPYQETSTPEEVWEIDFDSPEEWKDQDRQLKK